MKKASELQEKILGYRQPFENNILHHKKMK